MLSLLERRHGASLRHGAKKTRTTKVFPTTRKNVGKVRIRARSTRITETARMELVLKQQSPTPDTVPIR